jgi:hypothetical protein
VGTATTTVLWGRHDGQRRAIVDAEVTGGDAIDDDEGRATTTGPWSALVVSRVDVVAQPPPCRVLPCSLSSELGRRCRYSHPESHPRTGSGSRGVFWAAAV